MHDLLFMRGFFGGPPAPTVVGNEGFGRVAAVGPGVTNLKVGDHVLAATLSLTWRERLIAPAQELFPLPDGDRLQLAQLGSNPPTAANMRTSSPVIGSFKMQGIPVLVGL